MSRESKYFKDKPSFMDPRYFPPPRTDREITVDDLTDKIKILEEKIDQFYL